MVPMGGTRYRLILGVASIIVASACGHSFAFNIATWPGEDASVWAPPLNLTNVVAVSGGDWYAIALRADGTVRFWGTFKNGEAGLSNIVSITSGWCHELALKSDSTVVEYAGPCWGGGSRTTMPPGLSNVTALAAGYYHSLVLKSDGTCVSWGGSSQAYVPDGLSNVVAVAAGHDVSAALRADGSVVNWGFPDYGGTGGNGLTGISAIAMGHSHGLALRSNGTVVVWGSTVPPPPVELTNVVKIGAKQQWACALQSNGTLITWGSNGGQLDSPTQPLTNVLQLAPMTWAGMLLVGDGPPQTLWTLSNTVALAESTVKFKGEAVGTEPLAYQWYVNGAVLGGATRPTLTLTNLQPEQQGFYSVVASNAYGLRTNSGALLQVIPLRITAQPTNQAIYGGETATNYVAAEGPDLQYQWLCFGTNLAGQTLAQLTVTSVTTNHAGDYSVIVSNAYGWRESSSATLAVIPISVTRPPQSQSKYVGESATFSVSVAKNGPFRYQWRFNGEDLAEKTNSSLTITNVQTAHAGNYSVVVRNPYGITESSNAALTVVDSAPFITFQPANTVKWPGSSASFSVSANGSKPLNYQWNFQGTNLSGATNSVLNLTSLTTNHVGEYFVLVSNGVGSLTSSVVTLALVPVAQWEANAAPYNLPALPASLTNAVALAAGVYNLAITSDGSVVAWPGSAAPSSATNVVAVAARYSQNLALKSDGTVLAWGTISNVPPEVTNIVAIASNLPSDPSKNNCFAAKADGSVAVWGAPTIFANAPAYLRGAVGVAAGELHAIALRSDGTVGGWFDYVDYGYNAVPAGLSNMVAISAGKRHSLALRADGTVRAWGRNQYPGVTNVPVGLSNVVAISAGDWHSLALKSDGSVVAWGRSEATNTPASVSNAVAIAAGGAANLALLTSERIAFARQPQSVARPPRHSVLLSVGVVSGDPISLQWQFNGTNLIAATTSFYRISALTEATKGAYRVVVSNAFGVLTSATAQVTLAGNSVLAWGRNTAGQTNVPAGLSAIAVAGGLGHSLALRSDGTVAAWGNTSIVTNVPSSASNVTAIAAGNDHSLALKANGSVVTWGYGPAVPAGLTNAIAVAAGKDYSLALKADCKPVQWGTLNSPPSSLSNVVAIAGGYNHALALKSDASVVSWGFGLGLVSGWSNLVAIAGGNGFSLGLTTTGTVVKAGNIAAPPATLSNVVAIAAGGLHALALKSDGTAVGWGSNTYGQTNVPTGASNIVAVAGGDAHSLFLLGSADPAIVRQPAPAYAGVFNRVLLSVGAISRLPLAYQWRFNGNDIPGETNSWLDLLSVGTNATGTYTVVASNELGFVESQPALVSVAEVPPFVLTAPSSKAVSNVGPAILSVIAGGSEPLGFQWLKNGDEVLGATNPILSFATPRRADGGYYSVLVTNRFGSVVSAEARLRVVVPQQLGVPSALPDGSVALFAGDSDGGLLATNDLPFFSVWASTNLIHWELLPDSLSLSNGSLWVRDAAAMDFPQRFYRIGEKYAWRVRIPQRLSAPESQPGGRLLVFEESNGERLTPADLSKFRISASTNLVNWQNVAFSFNLTNGRAWWLDTSASNFLQRFYRVVELP